MTKLTARGVWQPGRPPKRSSGIPSPEPGNYGSSTPVNNGQQGSNNLLPLLGFSNTKKARFAEECEYGSENPELKQLNSGNVNLSTNSAATAAAMLAANGYSAAFPFLQHLSAAAANSMPNAQQQQLVAAAAALGLPTLPNRFGSGSPPPGVHERVQFANPANNNNSSSGGGNGGGNSAGTPDSGEFNPTAAYLWLLSQQQQHLPNAAAAAAALNLSSRNAAATNFLNGGSPLGVSTGGGGGGGNNNNNNNGSTELAANSLTTSGHNNVNKDLCTDNEKLAHNHASLKEKPVNKSHLLQPLGAEEPRKPANGNLSNGKGQVNSNLANRKRAKQDDDDDEPDDSSDDDDEDDDVGSRHSSNHSENPVSSTGFNGLGNGNSRSFLETMNNLRSNAITSQTGANGQQSQPEHCLETLLRNIEGLLAIAAHNARQQQAQLQLQKAEFRAELLSQLERERELREHIEKQFHEEQKIRILFQKRLKKERKQRRKLENELQQMPQLQSTGSLTVSSMSSNKSQANGNNNNNNQNLSTTTSTLTPLGSKSPVSSLPPTPPPHTTSSDEAD